MKLAACALAALLGCACSVGEGEGWIKSDRLYIEDCWNGPFDLGPDFFGANAFREQQLLVRVQRGDNIEELSDGLIVLINDLPAARLRTGEPLAVGLPRGVSPPGVPIEYDPDPPPVNLSLYLHASCHTENGTVYSVGGTITFKSLFSGDPNETDSEERLTEASFAADFADPRLLVGASAEEQALVTSHVTGYFRFFFQRGQPAQPFQ